MEANPAILSLDGLQLLHTDYHLEKVIQSNSSSQIYFVRNAHDSDRQFVLKVVRTKRG